MFVVADHTAASFPTVEWSVRVFTDLSEVEFNIMVRGRHMLAGRHLNQTKKHAPPNVYAQLA